MVWVALAVVTVIVAVVVVVIVTGDSGGYISSPTIAPEVPQAAS